VNLLSTYLEAEPMLKASRWSKKHQSRIDVNCPFIVKEYNNHMGGVDLADMLLALYRIDRRSKKYYTRIIYYLIGVCTTNAWIIYKINTGAKISLLEFTLQVSHSLINSGKIVRGISSAASSYNRKKTSEDVKFDDVGHIPMIGEMRKRCKADNCTHKSFIFCRKCNVYLCIITGNAERNCFASYHTPKKV
jgi:hypothetical protein